MPGHQANVFLKIEKSIPPFIPSLDFYKSHDISNFVSHCRHAWFLAHNSTKPVSYPANPRSFAQWCSHRRRVKLARRHYPMDPYSPASDGLGCHFSHRDGAWSYKKQMACPTASRYRYWIGSKPLLMCSGIGYRVRVDPWRLHSWPCTQRPSISFIGSRTIRFDTFHSYPISTCLGHLPEATHSRKISTSVCCDHSWSHWQDVSYIGLDTNAIRCLNI